MVIVVATSVLPLLAWETKPAFEVRRLSNWAPEYLTVINTYGDACFVEKAPTLQPLSVVTSINGISTADLDEKGFYSIYDNAKEVDLEWMTKRNGENKTYSQHLTIARRLVGQLKEIEFMPNSEIRQSRVYGVTLDKPILNSDAYEFENDEKTEQEYPTRVTADADYDLFKVNTFDYLFYGTEEDLYADRSYLQEFAKELKAKGFKKVDENPDVYIYVTRNVKNKVENVYVPQIITTTNYQGRSRTNGQSSYWHWGSGMAGRGSSNTQWEGESTTLEDVNMKNQALASSEFFLEFSILDAKRMESKSKMPPVVWQLYKLIHSGEFKDKFAGLKYAKAVMMLPFTSQQLFSKKINAFYFGNKSSHIAIFDVRVENNNNYKVTYVVPESYAEKKGVKVGDKLKVKDIYRLYHKKTNDIVISSLIPSFSNQRHDFIWFNLQE